MITYYAVTAILVAIAFFIFIFSYELKKINYFFMVMLMLRMIANSCYLILAYSTTLGEAILANKFCYIAGCFLPPLTLFWVCAICNIKIRKWVRNLIYGFCAAVYGMALTVGYSDFYYKTVSLEKIDGASVLTKTYGPGHTFFVLLLYGFLVLEAVLLVYSLIHKHTVSKKNLLLIVLLESCNVLMYFMDRMLGFTFEIMPLMYVIDSFILLFLHYRCEKYNLEDNIAAASDKEETCGYIMFDKRLCFLGANEVALKIYPQIADWAVDKPLQEMDGNEEVKEWLEAKQKGSKETFEVLKNEEHYICTVKPILRREKEIGYMVELKEDTDEWKYLNLLSEYNSDLKDVQKELEERVFEQTLELREQQKAAKELYIQTITALAEAVDAKDRYTSGHSKRVAEYSRRIAARMGKSKEEQEEIYWAGLLHDVGKIRVPNDIINKVGKLTEEEYDIIKIHPVTGYHILNGVSGYNDIGIGAKYHHERYDGKGYPNGLEGTKIPEVARILGVADSYDAMTSDRSYRKALPQDVVREEIIRGKGNQFDPDIADIMLEMMAEDTDYQMRQLDTMQRKILIVDDDPMNARIIGHMMKDEPMYEIIPACSGREALDILAEHSIDLIMLDVKMPDMDGLETLQKIREKYRMPVVLMTGDKTLDTSSGFAALGCDDYITKPFHQLMIKEVVHNMTENRYE